ncbi:MAG: hypothetical protein GXO54_04145 [Chloroflexi bacterium]|nr:hypothetical protein [Chloroflexota bacterium]
MRQAWWREPAVWLVMALWTLPYGLAWALQGDDHFLGVLLNPLDGFSYLAKMQQGYAGAWRFRLPYTADPGPGAYLFLFHLALGHLARVLHLPLLGVYHAARLSGAGTMVMALRWLMDRVYPDDAAAARRGFRWALLGSGFGGLLLPWAGPEGPLDLWLAEGYPWLAGFTNAHFPWALAALFVLMAPVEIAGWVQAGLAGFLSLLSPFGVALALPVRLGRATWHVHTGALSWRGWLRAWAPTALAGLPYPAYVWWVVRHDPVLAGWNAQNQTPLPGWGMTLAAFGPWVLLVLGGWLRGQRTGSARWPSRAAMLTFGLWLVVGAGLAALPIALQRRFLLGWVVPWAGLAAGFWPRSRWAHVVEALGWPTLFVFVAAVGHQSLSHSPRVYARADEWAAWQWLRTHTSRTALVLTGAESGAMLPAFTGRRVFYGHPMETVPAKAELAFIQVMLCDPAPPGAKADLLRRRGATHVLVGPREHAFCQGPLHLPAGLVERFRAGDVRVFMWRDDVATKHAP